MIKVKQLKKSFGGNQVLNGVDICIAVSYTHLEAKVVMTIMDGQIVYKK